MTPRPDPAKVQRLEAELRLPRALCGLLVVRGFHDPDAAKSFLRPLLSHLHHPELLPDLSFAVDRILAAVREGETILVHGDYDVDGMAGAALLTRWLRGLGGKVKPFLPHRVRDGYDLGPAGLKAAESAGATLLVTVDCGTTAHGSVRDARTLGMDVIVTDHHSPGQELPPALAVVNPSRRDSGYPNPHLCGAGVAFKLCQGMARTLGAEEEDLLSHLDLVALATVADLVPLEGENRVLARLGLKALARSRKPGLQALLSEAGLGGGQEVSAGKVAFVLAPRLNAVGRLGEPEEGLRLLLTDRRDEARRLARKAEETNRERREVDARTLRQALDHLSRSFDPGEDFGVVLDSEGWHPGVVGIVASRIVERVHRPAILLAMAGDRGRGSARSIPEYHLLEGLRSCGSFLERFGGHRQAAGMEIRRDQVVGFRRAFNAEARRVLEGKDLRPTLRVELEVSLREMTRELHHYLQYFGPHGMGNPTPSFGARGVTVAQKPRVVGSNHLKLRLRQDATELEAIGFRLADRILPGSVGRGPLDVVFQLHENEYRGVRRMQARLEDLGSQATSPWEGKDCP